MVDLSALQEVNEMFPPEMNNSESLSLEFHNKIAKFLVPLLRAFNHNLGTRLLKNSGEVGRD